MKRPQHRRCHTFMVRQAHHEGILSQALGRSGSRLLLGSRCPDDLAVRHDDVPEALIASTHGPMYLDSIVMTVVCDGCPGVDTMVDVTCAVTFELMSPLITAVPVRQTAGRPVGSPPLVRRTG